MMISSLSFLCVPASQFENTSSASCKCQHHSMNTNYEYFFIVNSHSDRMGGWRRRCRNGASHASHFHHSFLSLIKESSKKRSTYKKNMKKLPTHFEFSFSCGKFAQHSHRINITLLARSSFSDARANATQ